MPLSPASPARAPSVAHAQMRRGVTIFGGSPLLNVGGLRSGPTPATVVPIIADRTAQSRAEGELPGVEVVQVDVDC